MYDSDIKVRSVAQWQSIRRTVRFRSGLFPVAIRLRETPVPIPNTMVKPEAAENTMLATVWEDRRLPGFLKNRLL